MSTTEVNLLAPYRNLLECLSVVQRRHNAAGGLDVRVWTALCDTKRKHLVQRGVSEDAIAQVEREVQRG